MSRGKAYTRFVRETHIKRKKKLICDAHPWLKELGGWYKHDGQYSKGKIHCSCPLCSIKAYYGGHVLDLQERKQIESMKEELDELLNAVETAEDFE